MTNHAAMDHYRQTRGAVCVECGSTCDGVDGPYGPAPGGGLIHEECKTFRERVSPAFWAPYDARLRRAIAAEVRP